MGVSHCKAAEASASRVEVSCSESLLRALQAGPVAAARLHVQLHRMRPAVVYAQVAPCTQLGPDDLPCRAALRLTSGR